MRYNGDKDGIIKTPKHGEIAFSMETVYLCKVHKLFCRDAQCPHYLPLKKWNSSDLAQLMPAGTMVSFYSRYVPNRIEQTPKKLFHFFKVEKILKGSPDSIPSPSPLVKFQIMGGKICLRWTGKTCWVLSTNFCKQKV